MIKTYLKYCVMQKTLDIMFSGLFNNFYKIKLSNSENFSSIIVDSEELTDEGLSTYIQYDNVIVHGSTDNIMHIHAQRMYVCTYEGDVLYMEEDVNADVPSDDMISTD